MARPDVSFHVYSNPQTGGGYVQRFDTHSGLLCCECSGRMVGPHKSPKEDTWMNFYTQQHKQSCGIDLHTKAMYVCILDHHVTKLVHKNLPTSPEAFLRLLAPYREDPVVGVEGIFTWW
jgi:hypothetical protein